MAKLTDWLTESEKYEFCKSYGVDAESEFVERQEDYYISLLGTLHELLMKFFDTDSQQDYNRLKHALLALVKGLLLYSQKETADAFHGVRLLNNQLYVASIYYLCDYSAVASWVMSDIQMDAYEDESAQLLSFIVSGGKSASEREVRNQFMTVFKPIADFIVTGNDDLLNQEVVAYGKKYDNRDFDSPTDFYMTCVLRCVLKKFSRDNIWRSLRKIDSEFDWKEYAKHSYRQHIFSFLPSQQDAIDKGLLSFEGAFSLKMPTSAGKSYITELLIHYEIKRNPQARVLYLAPLRALSRELRDRFRKIHKGLGFTYATKYGGSAASIVEDGLDDAQLLVATPESFMSIESYSQETLDSFTLVICDEGQLLEDKSRGINYEMLLSRLRQRNTARFLFISAIIPNIDDVNSWLKGTDNHIGDSRYRPSKLLLAEALVGDDKVDLFVSDGENSQAELYIPGFISKEDAQGEVLRYRDKKNNRWKISAKPCGCTLALRALKAGSVLLFTTAKTRGVGCTVLAKHLMDMVENGCFDNPQNYVGDQIQLDKLKEYASYQLGSDHLFCQVLAHGFAYHHGDVPQDLREKIERAYDKGEFRLIVSNTTLAEGVNLPIKTIVIAYAMDQSNPGNYLPNTRLKNIIGRVGRAGRERYGTVMVPVTYRNSRLVNTIKEALNPDDSELEKMRGALFAMVEDLVNRKVINKDADINELLSVASFSDAIDEMIIRSADGDVNEMDMDALVSESLAYTLSGNEEKEVLKQVFTTRHNVLKETFEDERYQLAKSTGLNLRELDAVEEYITDEYVEMASELWTVDDDAFVSMMINGIFVLPTIKEEFSESSTKRRLFSDIDRVKNVAIMWMQGYQYHEIASALEFKVDDVVLVVMFLQGLVHDKAVSILAYISETQGLEKGTATFWPEYLRLGINTRLMYEVHKLRVPERIQMHAINAFFSQTDAEFGDFDFLENSLIENKDRIYLFMIEKGYPLLSTEGLMDVIAYMEVRE